MQTAYLVRLRPQVRCGRAAPSPPTHDCSPKPERWTSSRFAAHALPHRRLHLCRPAPALPRPLPRPESPLVVVCGVGWKAPPPDVSSGGVGAGCCRRRHRRKRPPSACCCPSLLLPPLRACPCCTLGRLSPHFPRIEPASTSGSGLALPYTYRPQRGFPITPCSGSVADVQGAVACTTIRRPPPLRRRCSRNWQAHAPRPHHAPAPAPKGRGPHTRQAPRSATAVTGRHNG